MSQPLPAPLPPESRTVGQLVAESIRLYGNRFWAALPLGASLAVVDQLSLGRPVGARTLILCAGAPLITASYIGATALQPGVAPTRRGIARALVLGTIVFLPAAVMAIAFYLLPALAWLALFGLVVPVAMIEQPPWRKALVRARRLGTADYVHALGSICALTIVFFLSRLVLIQLLQGQSNLAIRIAAFVADFVISPLIFIGSALLYFDQAARVVDSPSPRRRRDDADVHPAVDAHRAGRPNAQVEP